MKLWDVARGQEKLTLKGHGADILSVAFSSDGRTLASGSKDRTVKLWDVVSGHEKGTLKGHMGKVTSVSFSDDGQILASGSADKTVRLWEVDMGRELRTLKPPDPPYPVGPRSSLMITSPDVPRSRQTFRHDDRLIRRLVKTATRRPL